MKPIGYCKECRCPLVEEDNLSEIGYPTIYECFNCGYPNLRAEMLYESQEQYDEISAQWMLDISQEEKHSEISFIE